MLRRIFTLFICTAVVLCAQKYKGPQPEKPDLPYLLHADNLVPAEANEAKEENKKDQILYYIPGASSPARTPLSSPIFLFLADKLTPERLQLYRLEVKNGRREIMFSRKKKQMARPIRFSTNRVADNLYRLEVEETLENGEYSFSPSESNQVFCFEIY